LPISGLNVVVPKNGYASVFVEVTIAGTLPSGVNSLSFEVRQNDVRGRDGAGIDRFGPSSNLTWSATLSTTLAGQARFVGALNPNTPKQQYVFGEPVDGRAEKVKVLSFDLTAKNDNLRVTQITGFVTQNATTVQAVYLAQGNNVLDVRTPAASGAFTFDVTPANFIINKDQTVNFDVLVDFVAPNIPNVATFTVSVATTSGVNSLGDNISSPTQVTSELMRAVRLGPQFAVVQKTIDPIKDTGNNTTTVSNVVFRVNVKAVGGTLYVPASNTATITIETAGGSSQTVVVAPNAVRVGSTNVSAVDGYYVVPEGSTYEFEFRTSGQTFTGVQSVRARLSSFAFDNNNDPAAVMDTSPFLHDLQEFWTDLVAPRS
jgi:hypothetical protein